jgi:carbonic anhydrase
MAATDDLIAANDRYAAAFDLADVPGRPARGLAVITCMDVRIDPARAFGLAPGDAHVIRNAGGIVTDDALRSLVISQRLLDTEEVAIVQHTRCGLLTFTDDELKDAIEADVGIRPPFALEAFADLERNVRQSVARVRVSPFVPRREAVRGFVYDVDTGRLSEVV